MIAATTTLHVSTSFLGLPTEIRLQILGYLLPQWCGRNSATLQVKAENQTSSTRALWTNTRAERASTASGDSPTGSILTINHQIYNECCTLLKQLDEGPRKLIINEKTFWARDPQEMRQLVDADAKSVLDPIFMGIELSTICELTVVIKPCNFPGFVACASRLLVQLIRNYLLPGKSKLKNLSLILKDMQHSWGWLKPVWGERPRRGYRGQPLKALCFDYAKILSPLRIMRGTSISCTITLPYWMEFNKGMPHLRRLIQRDLSAEIFFQPIDADKYRTVKHSNPSLRGTVSLPARSNLLASLTDEDHQRAQRGMENRLALTGHWA